MKSTFLFALLALFLFPGCGDPLEDLEAHPWSEDLPEIITITEIQSRQIGMAKDSEVFFTIHWNKLTREQKKAIDQLIIHKDGQLYRVLKPNRSHFFAANLSDRARHCFQLALGDSKAETRTHFSSFKCVN
jgi:hypothetical protein